MELEIEVISKEIVKPSSPTPDELRRYQLSFLDQISPPVHNPVVLFYPTDGEGKINNTKKSNQLKQSLSEVLTHYYLLAGRVKGNSFVDCDDEGVPFLEAQVKCKLAQVIENPIPSELNKLVPFELDDAEKPPLGVQFNVFECGGVALGLCLSHKVGDASSVFNFIKSWAAACRGEADIARPEFVSASLFPPKNLSGFKPSTGIVKDNVVTKRFVFKNSSIEALKLRYGSSPSLEKQQPPSRVEALSAFIWSRFVACTKLESGPDRLCFMIHAVNLRKRMDPPLPDHSFGNYYRVAFTIPSSSGEGCDDNLVSQMRDSISKIDKKHVKMLQDGDEHLNFIRQQAEIFMKGEMVTLNFTSLCRFPLYEADFGWAKPIWVGSPVLTFKNLIVFNDTASGDGVEALVHLDGKDMAKLQEDEELLQFVTPTSS